jgi:hypothetical protein
MARKHVASSRKPRPLEPDEWRWIDNCLTLMDAIPGTLIGPGCSPLPEPTRRELIARSVALRDTLLLITLQSDSKRNSE